MADVPCDQDPPASPDCNDPYLAICPPAPLLRAPPSESVTDGTVTLRRWRLSDADALFTIITASRARLAAWMPWARGETYTREEAEAFTQRTTKRWDENQGWDYAVTVRNEVIGSCGLRRREDHPGVDAGYWLAEGYTGQGYATRAARLLTDTVALGEMGAPNVRIVHEEGNERSRKVPERLGFECQGEVDGEEGVRDVVWLKYPGPPTE